MKRDAALMPVATALALASVALQTSLEDATGDAMQVVLRRAQRMVERLASLPPEVLNGLEVMMRRGGALRRTYRRTAVQLH